MASIKVTFVQVDGVEKTIADAVPGESLMELTKLPCVALDKGDCGGGCACATCHVYVDPQWMAVVGAPDEIEEMTLDMASDIHRSNSRLCCQIMVRPELDGLRVTVAPGE